MAEQTTPLAALHEEFAQSRGVGMDSVWASGVSWSLLLRNVDGTQVADGLTEALALVRQTQESPEDLFGTAREHADALYERWIDEGRLMLAKDVTSWRDAAGLGLAMSAGFAAIFAVLLAVRGELSGETVVRLAAISLVVGLSSSLGSAAWERRHRPRSRADDASADRRWSAELTEILRTRHGLSGRRVRDVIAEAHAHAAESGRSVHEEFGTPAAYAAHFAPDRARRKRFEAAAWAAIALSAGILLLDDFDWFRAVFSALCLVIAVRTLRTTGSAAQSGR